MHFPRRSTLAAMVVSAIACLALILPAAASASYKGCAYGSYNNTTCIAISGTGLFVDSVQASIKNYSLHSYTVHLDIVACPSGVTSTTSTSCTRLYSGTNFNLWAAPLGGYSQATAPKVVYYNPNALPTGRRFDNGTRICTNSWHWIDSAYHRTTACGTVLA